MPLAGGVGTLLGPLTMELVLAHIMAGGAADIVTRVANIIATGVLPPPNAFSRSTAARSCLSLRTLLATPQL